ncbi:MAG: APC family permease [Pseudomonadales bacterium]
MSAPEPLLRQLSITALWLLIVNGMVGAGIFGLPAEAARIAGAFSPWVFVICAALMLPIILCFAQLASHFRGTGGPMLYAATAFGPMVGFQAGWAFYVARLTAFAANLNLLVVTLGYFWPLAVEGPMRITLLFVTCAMFTLINVTGAKTAIGWLGALTVLKFLPLIGIIAFGLHRLDPAMLTPVAAATTSSADLGAAILLVIYAYVGFESGLVPAAEARRPQRDMPRALIGGLLMVSLLYAAVQAVCMAVLPDLAGTTQPVVEVAHALLGPTGAVILTAGILASVGGNLLGSSFTTPRLTYRLALDGYLPRWLGAVHPRFKTPAWSIVAYGVLCFLLAAKGSFALLAGLSVLTRILLYLCCIGAIPRIRRQLGADPAALRLPGGYTIPAIAALICLALLTRVGGEAWLVTTGFLAAGTVLYYLARAARRAPQPALLP